MALSNDFMLSKTSLNLEDPEIYHDRVLMVGDTKFYVVSGILSMWSEYFRTLFSEKFEEADKKEIELKELDAETFKVFLQVLYQNKSVELKDEDVIPLIDLSYRFLAPNVLSVCREYIDKNFDKLDHLKLDLLDKACTYGNEELKGDIIANIKAHTSHLPIFLNYTDDYQRLVEIMWDHKLEDLKNWFVDCYWMNCMNYHELLDVAADYDWPELRDKVILYNEEDESSVIHEGFIFALVESAFKHNIPILKKRIRKSIFQMVKRSEENKKFGNALNPINTTITYNSFLKDNHEEIFAMASEISQFIIMSTVTSE